MKKALLFILLAQSTATFAQIDVETQEGRLDDLSGINHLIKITEAKVSLAQAELDVQTIQMLKSKAQPAAAKIFIKKTKGKTEDSKKIKTKKNGVNLNVLTVDSIINNQVTFDNLEGRYQVGSRILENIKIIKIDAGLVTLLNMSNGAEKVIAMDWIKD